MLTASSQIEPTSLFPKSKIDSTSDSIWKGLTPQSTNPLLEITEENTPASKNDGELISEFLQEKPYLQPPVKDLTWRLLELSQREVEIQELSLREGSDQIEALKEKKIEQQKIRMEKIEKAIAKQRKAKKWGWLAKIFAWIGAFFTIAVGVAALATGAGTFAGVALILSGTALLGTQLASEFGAWEKLADKLAKGNEEKRAKILKHLTIWSVVVSVGVSVGSAILGASSIVHHALKAILGAIQGALGIGTGVATIGRSVVDRDRAYMEMDSKKIETELLILQQRHDDLINRCKLDFERISVLRGFSKRILDLDEQKSKAINKALREGSAASAA